MLVFLQIPAQVVLLSNFTAVATFLQKNLELKCLGELDLWEKGIQVNGVEIIAHFSYYIYF